MKAEKNAKGKKKNLRRK